MNALMLVGSVFGLWVFYKEIRKWVIDTKDKEELFMDLKAEVNVMGEKMDNVNKKVENV